MTVTPFKPPYLPKKESYKPTHPDLFLINFGDGDYNSSLVTQKSFSKDEVICLIENTLPGIKKYSSVQVLPDPPLSATQDPNVPRHIELCSDLLYVNHSCDPKVAFEVPQNGPWQVRALRDLKKGEVMTFAYFSTEWDMDQPFECLCGAPRCLGTITGAKSIDSRILDTYYINDHIKALKAHQSSSNSSPLSSNKPSTLKSNLTASANPTVKGEIVI